MTRDFAEFEISKHAGTVREALLLAVPLMIANMSQSLMWVVDTLLMGRLGSAQQGAASFAGNMMWAVTCFFAGTVTVINVLVAQEFGAKAKDIARHLRTGLLIGLPMGFLLWLVVPWIPHILELMSVASQARPHAETYMTIRMYGAPIIIGTFAFSSFLRGIGDMVTPMKVVLAANVTNVVLSIVLVFGLLGFPAMGVAGAAWGTVAASGVELMLYAGVYFLRRSLRVHGTTHFGWPRLAELKRFLVLGVPIGLAWLLEMITWTGLTIYAGTRPVNEFAAHAIIFQVTGFCFMPTVAIGVGASTLVGQYIGAERYDLARKSARSAIMLGIGYMSAVGVAIALGREPLLRLFSQDPLVLPVGTTLALIAATYQPFEGYSLVAQGVLRGAYHTALPVVIMLLAGVMVCFPALWWFSFHQGMGIRGVWWAAVCYTTAMTIGVHIALRKSRLYRQTFGSGVLVPGRLARADSARTTRR